MAYINTVQSESIQVGDAITPPFATLEVWQSLDPTKPFAFQSYGINNLVGLTNQLGLYYRAGLELGTRHLRRRIWFRLTGSRGSPTAI